MSPSFFKIKTNRFSRIHKKKTKVTIITKSATNYGGAMVLKTKENYGENGGELGRSTEYSSSCLINISTNGSFSKFTPLN